MVVPATLLRAGYKAKASIHSTTSFRPHSLPRLFSARFSSSTCLSNTFVFPIRFPLYGIMHKHKEDIAQDPIRVTEPTVKQEKVGIPEHWDGPSGKAFKNPWDSFRLATVGDMFGVCHFRNRRKHRRQTHNRTISLLPRYSGNRSPTLHPSKRSFSIRSLSGSRLGQRKSRSRMRTRLKPRGLAMHVSL